MSLQKEDVYETEDIPEEDQDVYDEELNESEDVEHVHIDVDDAMKRFKGRLLSAENVDFSDSISRKKRKGYGSGAYVLEVLGSCTEEPETVEQRFNRLNCEINELIETVHNNEEPTKPNETKICEQTLISMLETLKAMQVKRGAQPLKDDEKESGDASETLPHSSVSTDGRWITLEGRLSHLEKLVNGGGSSSSEESFKAVQMPISETLEDLRMRVQTLHPSYVDGLHMRITQLLSKMQQLEEKKKEKGCGEWEEKVDKVYELMSKWDSSCNGLSSAVQRMRGLMQLHEQAQHFNTKLNLLAGVREQFQKRIEDQEMTIFEFREQMKYAFEKLHTDMEKLDQRMTKLGA